MAHNLFIEHGKAKLFYHGEPPWHGLGQQLSGPATSREAIQAAGLNWEVEKHPIHLLAHGRPILVQGKVALVRSDLLKAGEVANALGLVGQNYQPIQNHEAFEFFDELVGGPGQAIYHTAGALGAGERVWILCKLPGNMVIARGDVTEKFLLLSNSHDGQSSIQLKFTPIRVVCQNTLTMALEKGSSIRIPHRQGIRRNLTWAAETLGILQKRFAGLEENFQTMAKRPMETKGLEAYLDKLFPLADETGPDELPKLATTSNQEAMERKRLKALLARKAVAILWDQGKGSDIPSVRHSLWMAYNAVAEMVDHCSRKSSMASTDRSRHLDQAWFKEGHLLKTRAYQAALDTLKPVA